MGATTSARTRSEPGLGRLYGLYWASLGACLLGNLLIRLGDRAGWLPASGQMALGMATVIPLFVAAALFWRVMKRELDEMLQRIVLEGLAFALIVYVPLAALYVNLRTAGVVVPRLDPPDILLAPALLAALGIELARRRYQ